MENKSPARPSVFSLGESAIDSFDSLARPSSIMSTEEITQERTLIKADTAAALRELLETDTGSFLRRSASSATNVSRASGASTRSLSSSRGGGGGKRGTGRRCTNSGAVSDTFTAALEKHAKARARRSLKHVNKVQAKLSGTGMPEGAPTRTAGGSFVGRSISGMTAAPDEQPGGFCGNLLQCFFRWGGCDDDVEEGWLVIPPNAMWKHVWDAVLLVLVLYNVRNYKRKKSHTRVLHHTAVVQLRSLPICPPPARLHRLPTLCLLVLSTHFPYPPPD